MAGSEKDECLGDLVLYHGGESGQEASTTNLILEHNGLAEWLDKSAPIVNLFVR